MPRNSGITGMTRLMPHRRRRGVAATFPAVPDGKKSGTIVDGDTTIVIIDVHAIADQIATRQIGQ